MDGFCYFEMNYYLRRVVYPLIFNNSLQISRLLDIAPQVALRKLLLDTQFEVSKELTLLEFINHTRPLPAPVEPEA